MKTRFKMLLICLLLGWIPFIIMAGIHADMNSLSGYALSVGLVFLLSSWLVFLFFLQDDNFWKTQKQLEEKIAEYREAIERNNREGNNYIKACIKLSQKIMEIDAKEKNYKLDEEIEAKA